MSVDQREPIRELTLKYLQFEMQAPYRQLAKPPLPFRTQHAVGRSGEPVGWITMPMQLLAYTSNWRTGHLMVDHVPDIGRRQVGKRHHCLNEVLLLALFGSPPRLPDLIAWRNIDLNVDRLRDVIRACVNRVLCDGVVPAQPFVIAKDAFYRRTAQPRSSIELPDVMMGVYNFFFQHATSGSFVRTGP